MGGQRERLRSGQKPSKKYPHIGRDKPIIEIENRKFIELKHNGS